jgi:hypothetical protein
VAALGTQLASETVEEQTFWFAPASQATHTLLSPTQPQVHLLPIYDEYISYADRRHLLAEPYKSMYDPQKKQVVFQYKPFRPCTPAEDAAVRAQAHRFGQFLGMTVVIE